MYLLMTSAFANTIHDTGPWKHQKARRAVMFKGDIERDQSDIMGYTVAEI